LLGLRLWDIHTVWCVYLERELLRRHGWVQLVSRMIANRSAGGITVGERGSSLNSLLCVSFADHLSVNTVIRSPGIMTCYHRGMYTAERHFLGRIIV
jgi:hypothetical protein